MQPESIHQMGAEMGRMVNAREEGSLAAGDSLLDAIKDFEGNDR